MKKILNYIVLHMVGNRSAKGIKYSHQLKYYRQFQKMQWNTLEENKRYQQKKLYEIVKFAIENVPYYRDLQITDISEETIFEDIKRFPVLTKDIIRREGERMIPECTLDDWTYWDQSGGSTGVPLKFLHSGKFFDEGQGIALAFDAWAGRKLGERQIRLWGSERDFLTGKKDWMNKIYRWVRNEEFLNTFTMDDAKIGEYIACINKKKPVMLLAYVQSIREIALYIERNKCKMHCPKGIMTSAGTLTKEHAEWFRDVFGCPIINRYGSREAGPIACSCDKNEGLHVNMQSNYIEILDDNDNYSDEGRVILTLLTEYAMPLIRYDIGDSASVSNRICSCGRGLEMLDAVHGRKTDYFTTPEGEKIHGEFFTHLLYPVPQIIQFQIVQDTVEHVTLKIIVADDVSDRSFLDEVVTNIKKLLGQNVQVEIMEVDNIPPTASGKRAYTVSYVE